MDGLASTTHLSTTTEADLKLCLHHPYNDVETRAGTVRPSRPPHLLSSAQALLVPHSSSHPPHRSLCSSYRSFLKLFKLMRRMTHGLLVLLNRASKWIVIGVLKL